LRGSFVLVELFGDAGTPTPTSLIFSEGRAEGIRVAHWTLDRLSLIELGTEVLTFHHD